MKTKEELLKIYSAYLPYELQFENESETYQLTEIETIGIEYNIWACNRWDEEKLQHIPAINVKDNSLGKGFKLDEVKPILYSMDYLTKEIEHEGERFVPMIKLLELQETNHFSSNKNIKDVTKFDVNKVIDCETKKFEFHTEWTEHRVRYLVETSNMGTLIYCLLYDEGFDRFHHRDETRKITLGVAYQRQMFEKLYEWHFNVFGLSDSEFIKKENLNK